MFYIFDIGRELFRQNESPVIRKGLDLDLPKNLLPDELPVIHALRRQEIRPQGICLDLFPVVTAMKLIDLVQ